MYLILGSASDLCPSQVNSALKARGQCVRMIEVVLSEPHRFAWRFAGGGSLGKGSSQIGVTGEWEVSSDEIEGVLVRDTFWPALGEWSPKDVQYMLAEMQGTLLGWLWSLPCMVINRLPAWLFHNPRPSLLDWAPLLQRAGLHTLATVISNDRKRLNDWRVEHGGIAILSPLSSHAHFQVANDAEWEGVMRVAQDAPVLLQEAHSATSLGCVVGERVIWDRVDAKRTPVLEAALCTFARIAGLHCVQIAVSPRPGISQSSAAGYVVVSVEPQVQYPRFSRHAQGVITEAIADLLQTSSQPWVNRPPNVEEQQMAASNVGAR